MGQLESSQSDQSQGPVDVVQGKLRHHTGVLKRIAKLSYAEFLDSLHELNQM